MCHTHLTCTVLSYDLLRPKYRGYAGQESKAAVTALDHGGFVSWYSIEYSPIPARAMHE